MRTETLSILRTEKRTAIEELREQLDEEDRALLVLRVDRKLDWLEVARVFAADQKADLDREAARLRKRFQLVKERLRRLAKAHGILGP